MVKQPVTWSKAARDRFQRQLSYYQRRCAADALLLALLLFSMGCLWFTVGRWLCLGAILMFLPKIFSDTSRLLDFAIVRDRLGMPPQPGGRHCAEGLRKPGMKNTGKHPRPTARNKA